jgi:hypothetical protein
MKGRISSVVLGAVGIAASLVATPAMAKSGDIEDAIAAGFTACHAWVTNPDSWSDDIAGFAESIGLEDEMQQRETVPGFARPPGALQEGAIYWHIDAGKSALYLTVSVTQPVCRLVGGGPEDWQPAVEKVLASKAFRAGWDETVGNANAGMRLSRYAGTADEGLSLIVTRADKAGAAQKDVQFLATARLR